MNAMSCEFCDKFFVPIPGEEEIRCPYCSAVQSRSAPFDFKEENTELAIEQSAIPKAPPEEEMFFAQEARVEKLSEPKKLPQPVWYDWRQYIPTLLVCGMLALWVFYDRVVRLNEFELTLTYSVQALNTEDLDSALKLADRALQLKPKSLIAQQLYEYIEKKSSTKTRLKK